MPWKQIYVYVNYVYIIIDWGIRAPHYRQLASMSKPGSALTFTYDADGNRTSKTVNGVTTTYTYADGRVTHEINGTDTLHYRYDTNGTLLSMNLNGAEYYLPVQRPARRHRIVRRERKCCCRIHL